MLYNENEPKLLHYFYIIHINKHNKTTQELLNEKLDRSKTA